ncbi:MAG: hypothetical protein HY827_03760 [Actinobacteria bacterium]|nr:hypothetical protein [Actinomycetota bacterium]
MATFEELDALSAEELHDQAIARATKHVDLRFFWNLLAEIPAAEAAAGNMDQSTADIFKVGSLVREIFEADEGELAEGLRPFYIDYLQTHGE